ncbi:c-type cytochrome [Marimonas arenosa]|uniref:Cytochrome c n=1 Tax=Marimonas arenosa TaxID=1795305 RepID=A0AAE4B280_9RHOB|nr:cytochrome c [Marimonas arenosa]MDQ2088773.1 cytochrome c [Marimonas arenosa]
MKKTVTALAALFLAGTVTSPAIAESHMDPAVEAAIKARKAQMQLYAFNIGLLGGMAKDAIPYDADAASKAAANLAALSKLDQSRLWPQGSDNSALGEATAALPAIWAEGSDIMAKGMAFVEASAAMEQAAGGGLDSLKAAIGPLGASCGGCHKAYRQPKD